MASVDDHEAILMVVRGLVEQGGSKWLTGPIRAVREARETLDLPLLTDVRNDAAEVTRLELLRIDGDSAQVALAATRKLTARWNGRMISAKNALGGPVTVVRDGSDWRVSDYFLNGRDVSASIRDLALTGRIDAVDVRAVAAWFGTPGQLQLVLDAVNSDAAPIRVSRVALGYRRRSGRWAWGGTYAFSRLREFPNGAMRFEVSGRVPEGADGVRVLLQSERGLIDVRPARVGQVDRSPLAARLPYYLPYVLVVAVLAVTVGVSTTVGGAVLFLAIAGWLLERPLRSWTRSIAPRPAATRARAVIGLALTAAALAASGALFALTRINLDGVPSLVFLLVPIALLGLLPATRRRSPKRSPATQVAFGFVTLGSLLTFFALLIVFAFPLSNAKAAAQQATLGRVAIAAVRSGHMRSLMDNTYARDREYVDLQAKTANEFVYRFDLSVVGMPKRGQNLLVYTLKPKLAHISGSFRLTIKFAQVGRKERIWDLQIVGTASQSIEFGSGTTTA